MNWRRFRSWLARLISPTVRVEATPGTECDHSVDPEATMHRLVAAVVDPLKFAAVLGEFSDCTGCSMAVLANLACTLAGIAVVDQADDEPAEYECEHASLNPEIIALRLVLAREAKDGTVLGSTLGEIDQCPHCVGSVFLCLLNAHTAILDNTGVDWAPLVEKRLALLLPVSKK